MAFSRSMRSMMASSAASSERVTGELAENGHALARSGILEPGVSVLGRLDALLALDGLGLLGLEAVCNLSLAGGSLRLVTGFSLPELLCPAKPGWPRQARPAGRQAPSSWLLRLGGWRGGGRRTRRCGRGGAEPSLMLSTSGCGWLCHVGTARELVRPSVDSVVSAAEWGAFRPLATARLGCAIRPWLSGIAIAGGG